MRSFNNAALTEKSKYFFNWHHEVIKITILYGDVHVSFRTCSGPLTPDQSKDMSLSAARKNIR
jgi:hypothetical protein